MNVIHKLDIIHCVILYIVHVQVYVCTRVKCLIGAVFIILLLSCVCEKGICKREDYIMTA